MNDAGRESDACAAGNEDERILAPIDIRKCPLEVFPVLNSFAHRPKVTLILLHVVALNILLPESHIYDELIDEAGSYLERLSRENLDSNIPTLIHVRTGKPAEEIRAEAKANGVSLIIIPTYGPSFWRRLTFLWRGPSRPALSALAEKVNHVADCRVVMVRVRTKFDCERAWGRPAKKRMGAPASASLSRTENLPALNAAGKRHSRWPAWWRQPAKAAGQP